MFLSVFYFSILIFRVKIDIRQSKIANRQFVTLIFEVKTRFEYPVSSIYVAFLSQKHGFPRMMSPHFSRKNNVFYSPKF
jgi:hypothetical protein